MLFEARNLCVGYGGAPAISDVSIEVDEGEIVSVIGPNGAGKSTLINAIAGLLDWQVGTIHLAGVDLKSVPPHLVCAQGIALVPEGRRLFPGMSVEENLDIGCYRPEARARRAASLERAYTLFPVLRERRSQLAGTLSGGQQQMVAIARALLNDNRVLLVDEPTKGLAPALVAEVARVLERLAELTTVLLVEQNLGVVRRIARDAIVLDQGRVVHTGDAQELLGQPDLVRRLLSVGSHA